MTRSIVVLLVGRGLATAVLTAALLFVEAAVLWVPERRRRRTRHADVSAVAWRGR